MNSSSSTALFIGIPLSGRSLALSWERSGEYKKAIAAAWTAVPLDGKTLDSKDRRTVHELLTLIIRNAKKTGSQADIQEAQELLK